MNLVEVMVAALVFALASNASLQLWSSSASWSQRAQLRQETMRRIDGVLLRQEHRLRRSAAEQRAAQPAEAPPPADCAGAAEWMGHQLAAPLPLPEGVSEVLEPAAAEGGGGLWLVLRAEEQAIERRRLFLAAAHGLCRPAATDAEVGA